MRTEKGFRFTLQFPAYTAEQQQAGEFLERLGSKKSSVVVQALSELLQKNPDLLENGGTIQVTSANAGLSNEELRALIREELAKSRPILENTAITEAVQEDMIASILDNTSFFS